MSMYLRVKHLNETIFRLVEPSDSFLTVKQALSRTTKKEPQDIQLWHTNKTKELVDLATVADQELASDSVIYMCLRNAGDQFESIKVEEICAPPAAADDEKESSEATA